MEPRIDSTKILYVDTIRSVFTWIKQNDNQIVDDRSTISSGFIVEKNDSTLIGQIVVKSFILFEDSNNIDSTTSLRQDQSLTLAINNIVPLEKSNIQIDSSFFLNQVTHALLGSINSYQFLENHPLEIPVYITKTDSTFLMKAKFSLIEESNDSTKDTLNIKFGFRIEGQSTK